MPADTGFATKPQIASAMIERAVAAGVPFAWVATDSVYGVGALEAALRQAGKGYVLGVNANSQFHSWGKMLAFAGTAACPSRPARLAAHQPYRRLSLGR